MKIELFFKQVLIFNNKFAKLIKKKIKGMNIQSKKYIMILLLCELSGGITFWTIGDLQ